MSHDDSLTAREFQGEVGRDWRALGVGACAWFAADSHTAGAELVHRLLAAAAGTDVAVPFVEVRAGGVRVRLAPEAGSFTAGEARLAREISTAAAELGLTTDPSVLQDVQLTFDAMDQRAVMGFWEVALGYDRVGDDDLVDPLRRHPPIWFQDQDAPRPLRNRLHLDSVAPQEEVARAVSELGRAGAAVRDNGYYATVSDVEGNEVDLLPQVAGADRWEAADGMDPADLADWRLVFSGVACYRVDSPARAADLTSAVAALADEAGLPLGIDLRPGVVVLDTGKDRWEADPGYAHLAERAQAVARRLGLVADPSLARFVQVGIDAVDIAAVREFWRAALGYQEDPREGVTDIVDPLRLNTVLFFQDLEAGDTERRAQRNRIHVDLFVADDQAQARVDAALAAGGTLVRESSRPQTWTLADPEGNELDITYSVGREELFRQLTTS